MRQTASEGGKIWAILVQRYAGKEPGALVAVDQEELEICCLEEWQTADFSRRLKRV